ncbi:hypothetical protein CDQ75_07610 [Campylobacter hyointestinalis subsp. hyointestinalis]|nr:hypothetical protein CDQ68_07860 [Campylobacter hyointestinalis subsp. hyointestinalis]PPB52815.1 hypothetical protein CDQ69_07250 [Campylobacter hyointestinalis subsp. hyointestinalis]PPB52881.1 hypothetical protein CDQ67_09665 [Campylobacter hyointestinalis subsp. hyointestinalis]PPB62142.1 hypothetical protein CDQ72_03350 [Campylobacter hyointestinalis subsp. hyointestinalis]PPB65831.1 hypothetical protein CDQ75_07610 [Campylobacter hyointestinalis subsp. hyointestinalis]
MFNFLFNFTEFLVLMLSKIKLYYIVSLWLAISIFINIFFSIKISQNIGISIIFYFIMYCLKDLTNFEIYIKKISFICWTILIVSFIIHTCMILQKGTESQKNSPPYFQGIFSRKGE